MPVDDIGLPSPLLEIRVAEHRQHTATEEDEPFVVIQIAVGLVAAEVVRIADEIYGEPDRIEAVIEALDGRLASV